MQLTQLEPELVANTRVMFTGRGRSRRRSLALQRRAPLTPPRLVTYFFCARWGCLDCQSAKVAPVGSTMTRTSRRVCRSRAGAARARNDRVESPLSLRIEDVARGGCRNQRIRVGLQKEALRDNSCRGGLHHRDIVCVRAVALLERQPRVALDQTLTASLVELHHEVRLRKAEVQGDSTRRNDRPGAIVDFAIGLVLGKAVVDELS